MRLIVVKVVSYLKSIFQLTLPLEAQIANVAFKGTALTLYLFGSLVGLSFVFNFVLIILCLAFDFWTVKNVTGRLLVVNRSICV